jgi:SpoIID/LytB domain protein
MFTIDREAGGGWRLRGGGWGHGAGLCQWGAVGRARAGQDHREILRAYFSGAEVAKVY